jgi:actin-related protein
MVRPRNLEAKPTLNVSINPHVYRRLKEEVGDRKVSGFVERAIVKELAENDRNLDKKTKEFQQKLIADYKRDSKALRKEDEI